MNIIKEVISRQLNGILPQVKEIIPYILLLIVGILLINILFKYLGRRSYYKKTRNKEKLVKQYIKMYKMGRLSYEFVIERCRKLVGEKSFKKILESYGDNITI